MNFFPPVAAVNIIFAYLPSVLQNMMTVYTISQFRRNIFKLIGDQPNWWTEFPFSPFGLERVNVKSFSEAQFFIIIFTQVRSKLAWSTQQASSMHLKHGTSLLSTPLQFLTCIITIGK